NSPQPVGNLEALPETLPTLPWGHHVLLIEKVKDRDARQWYAAAALAHGWSRAILVHHIELALYERKGSATTNVSATLSPPESELAHELLKDPYSFDFLTLRSDAVERDVEEGCCATCASF